MSFSPQSEPQQMTTAWTYQNTRAYRGGGGDIPFSPGTASSGAVSAISSHFDDGRGTRAQLQTSSLLSSWNLGPFSGVLAEKSSAWLSSVDVQRSQTSDRLTTWTACYPRLSASLRARLESILASYRRPWANSGRSLGSYWASRMSLSFDARVDLRSFCFCLPDEDLKRFDFCRIKLFARRAILA